MKKLSTVLLLALVALTACAWTAKGTGTQPAESKPTEPPAVAAVAVQPPAPEPEPKEPEWIEYETASGAVAEQGVTIAADWDVLPPGTVIYIDGLGERVVQDRGGAIKGNAVDIYFEDHDEALVFGRQAVRLYIIEERREQS